MEFLYIGKLVNTHGIKGEVKILSNFTKKEFVFVPGFTLYLGNKKIPFTINSYRHHKMFDMVNFEGITNINEVLEYKGLNVYINKEDLKLPDNTYLLEDLIGLEVIEDGETLGKIEDLMYNNGNDLLSVSGKSKFYIPVNGEFIKNVDTEKRIVEVKNAKGLIL